MVRDKRTLNGWIARKILEETEGYEAAVGALSTAKLVVGWYNVVGGIRTGIVIVRSRDSAVASTPPGESNSQRHVVLAPPSSQARAAAGGTLNAAENLAPNVLLAALSDTAAQAKDTFLRTILAAEANLFSSSLPLCTTCPDAAFGSAAEVDDAGLRTVLV